jgi:hypothetical protein
MSRGLRWDREGLERAAGRGAPGVGPRGRVRGVRGSRPGRGAEGGAAGASGGRVRGVRARGARPGRPGVASGASGPGSRPGWGAEGGASGASRLGPPRVASGASGLGPRGSRPGRPGWGAGRSRPGRPGRNTPNRAGDLARLRAEPARPRNNVPLGHCAARRGTKTLVVAHFVPVGDPGPTSGTKTVNANTDRPAGQTDKPRHQATARPTARISPAIKPRPADRRADHATRRKPSPAAPRGHMLSPQCSASSSTMCSRSAGEEPS